MTLQTEAVGGQGSIEVFDGTLGGTSAKSRSFDFYRNATFLSLFIGYAGYYLCRQNLGVAYAPMKESLGIDAIQFGWISSGGTLMYAVGKVLTGSLADSKKRGGRSIFYLGLFGSVLFSIAFGLGHGLAFFLFTWSLNRISQSMGWGGLVNIIAHWFPKKTYGTAMGFMAVSYQVGGVAASLYAGFILSQGGGWQSLFIIPALTLGFLGLATRPFLTNHPRDVGHILREDLSESVGSNPVNDADSDLSYLGRFASLLKNRSFVTMLGLAFIITFLRECFNLWMPAYFSEMGASASVAAFKSTVFPLLGCVGTLFAGWFTDRYLAGRRAPVMAVMMACLVFSLAGLGSLHQVSHFLQSHFSLNFPESQLAVFFVGAVGFFLLGPYSMVAGVVALDFGGKKTAGTAAGILDGTGYLGAALSGIGVASLVVKSGWNITFITMSVCALVGMFFCLLLWKVRPI